LPLLPPLLFVVLVVVVGVLILMFWVPSEPPE